MNQKSLGFLNTERNNFKRYVYKTQVCVFENALWRHSFYHFSIILTRIVNHNWLFLPRVFFLENLLFWKWIRKASRKLKFLMTKWNTNGSLPFNDFPRLIWHKFPSLLCHLRYLQYYGNQLHTMNNDSRNSIYPKVDLSVANLCRECQCS